MWSGKITHIIFFFLRSKVADSAELKNRRKVSKTLMVGECLK
jgi:hypothetical protein